MVSGSALTFRHSLPVNTARLSPEHGLSDQTAEYEWVTLKDGAGAGDHKDLLFLRK